MPPHTDSLQQHTHAHTNSRTLIAISTRIYCIAKSFFNLLFCFYFLLLCTILSLSLSFSMASFRISHWVSFYFIFSFSLLPLLLFSFHFLQLPLPSFLLFNQSICILSSLFNSFLSLPSFSSHLYICFRLLLSLYTIQPFGCTYCHYLL